jgi:hypothetical protein
MKAETAFKAGPFTRSIFQHRGELTRKVGESLLSRLALRVATGVLIAAACFSLVPAPAEAARQIHGPAWHVCNRYPATISISPPRIWASYRTEQVVWVNQLQRWNGTRWYNYSRFTTWSSFNYYGYGVTPWAGGRFHNSTLNLRVAHRGNYRVAAAINGNQGGVTWTAFIGRGAYCYIR